LAGNGIAMGAARWGTKIPDLRRKTAYLANRRETA
jgi:hypothetical protein